MHKPSHSTGAPAPSITRRAALIGAVASSAALAVPAVAAVAKPASQLAELDDLIAKHRDALALDGELWDRVCEIDDTLAGRRPLCRVQTGRLLHFGRNDDGSEKWEPIYSYSVEAIEKKRDEDIDNLTRWHAFGPHAEANAKIIREKRNAWADAKIAELRALEAEAKAVEDDSGYTDAREAARAASFAVREIEKAILDLVPVDLPVAAKKAGWVADLYRSDNFLSDGFDGALLLVALDAIAAAVRHG